MAAKYPEAKSELPNGEEDKTVAKTTHPALHNDVNNEVNALTKALTENGMGTVEHGAVAGTARPKGFKFIRWLGSIAPTNMVAGDEWIQTT